MDPPPHFGIVQPLLYRSSSIQSTHLPYLRSLHLKSILSLSAEQPTKVILAFCEANAVDFVHLGNRLTSLSIPHKQNYEPLSNILITEGLEFLLEKKHCPCLVTDLNGESGVFFGCLRRLQGWILSSALSEVSEILATPDDSLRRVADEPQFSSFAGVKTKYSHEQSIELFDVDLVTFPPASERVSWISER